MSNHFWNLKRYFLSHVTVTLRQAKHHNVVTYFVACQFRSSNKFLQGFVRLMSPQWDLITDQIEQYNFLGWFLSRDSDGRMEKGTRRTETRVDIVQMRVCTRRWERQKRKIRLKGMGWRGWPSGSLFFIEYSAEVHSIEPYTLALRRMQMVSDKWSCYSPVALLAFTSAYSGIARHGCASPLSPRRTEIFLRGRSMRSRSSVSSRLFDRETLGWKREEE